MSMGEQLMEREIRAVVFDLDGLMFNTEDVFNRSGNLLVERRGKTLTPEVLTQMMGRRADESFAILVRELELSESIPDLQAEASEIFVELLSSHLAPMPGLYELLDRIESCGLPKGVATSSGRTYLEDILGRYDLLDRFAVTLTAEDVTQGKPNPEIYLKAADRIGVDPRQMLVLEDSETGSRAAAAANAVVISVPHEHSRHQDFGVATHVVASLHDPVVFNLLR